MLVIWTQGLRLGPTSTLPMENFPCSYLISSKVFKTLTLLSCVESVGTYFVSIYTFPYIKKSFYIQPWLFYQTMMLVVFHVVSLTCALRTLTFSLSNQWVWLGYEQLSLSEALEVICQKPAMIISLKDCTVSRGSSFSFSTRKTSWDHHDHHLKPLHI